MKAASPTSQDTRVDPAIASVRPCVSMPQTRRRSEAIDSTLCKGLAIIESLAEHNRAMGVSELAVSLGINKSNIHRLLRSLIELGYVQQLPNRSYTATLKTWTLGVRITDSFPVMHCARDEISRLAQSIGECVHLSVLEGMETLYVEKVEARGKPAQYFRKGGAAPLHCTATGKLLLAANYTRLRLAVSRRLTGRTEKTITTLNRLDDEIDNVRRSRFALNLEEMQKGVNVLAAPICNSAGAVIAALGVSGPNERLPLPRLMQHLPDVKRAAQAISQQLSLK